jgi:hypothetical protein
MKTQGPRENFIFMDGHAEVDWRIKGYDLVITD